MVSWIVESARNAGTTSSRSTTTSSPACTRCADFVTTTPSTRTCAPSMSVRTRARLASVIMATTRSIRSSSRAAGTMSRRVSIIERARCPRVAATHILQLEDHEDDATRDTHVRHIEHRPELEIDEVDDVPGHEPVWSTDQAIDDVAHRTAEDQRDAHGRGHRARLAGEARQHDHHDAGDHAEQRTLAFAQAERSARITHDP